METKDLEFALKLAQPCLLGVDFIPVLSHYCFDKGVFYAYDGVSAIIVTCETDLSCAVRGDTLLGLVSLAGEKLSLKQAKDKVEVVSGNSRAELPCLLPKDFLLQLPEQDQLCQFFLTEELVKGLALCSSGVGQDPRRPEFTGVTLQLGKEPIFYSSDNTSITKYTGTEAVGEKQITVILPKSICDQILATATVLEAKLNKVKITLTKEFVIAQFDDTIPVVTIIGKLLTVTPAKFEQIIASCKSNKPKFEIPEGFDKAVAKVVLVTNKELQKDCVLETNGEKFLVRGEGSLGKAETKFDTDHLHLPGVLVSCSPEHLTKMLTDVTHMVVDEKAVLMQGNKLSYYVATRA